MGKPYELNVGRVEADYPEYRIAGGDGGFGYEGRRLGSPRITAGTLDELAVKLDADRKRRGGKTPAPAR